MRPWQITTLAKIENLVPPVTILQHETAAQVLRAVDVSCFPASTVFRDRDGTLHVRWTVNDRAWEVAITPSGQPRSMCRWFTGEVYGGEAAGSLTDRLRRDARWLLNGAESDAAQAAEPSPPASFTTPFLAPQRIVDWLNHWVTQGAAGEIQLLIEREVRLPAALEERETDQYTLLVREPLAQPGEERSVCLSVLGLLNSLVWPSGCRIVAHYGDARAGGRLLRFALATHEEYQAKAGPDTPPTLTPARS